jgi:POT family proton-dependent oligopeptide transporter
MNMLFDHPRGIYICFMTEMWERFSYYGMRALLILYLTKHFLFTDDQSFAIYGAYSAMAYAMPVFGGMIADRYLGSRKAVTLGAIFLVMGHFGMAIEGAQAVQSISSGGVTTVSRDPVSLQIFYFSLALLVTGIGFLKPNISTIVGKLYAEGDPRRDSGFTIFYIGINLGALLGAALCGYLGEVYGWRYGFGLAGITMLLGLLVFLKGQPLLEGHAEPPTPEILKEKKFAGLSFETTIYLSAALAVFPIWQLVQRTVVVGSLLGLFGVVASLGVIAFSLLKCNPVERSRMLVALTLTFFSIVFWSFFEQAGSSMNLFADRNVNRDVLGHVVPASVFQSVNSIFIVIFGLIISWIWLWLNKRKLEPNTPVKFALGIFQLALGFGAMVLGARLAGADGQVALIWLVLGYLLHTTGELCLSPVGLSMITKLSVRRVVGMMMGIWFLSTAGAEFLASLIAQATSVPTVAGAITDPRQSLTTYSNVFEHIFWAALAASLIVLLLSPLLKRGMHGIH